MLTLAFLPLGSRRTGAAATLVAMTERAAADAVMDGYPEYATSAAQLSALQRSVLQQLARVIVRSHGTRSPIDAVAVIGHADKALRKAASERAAFELEISQLRAASARQALLDAVRLLASGAHFSKVLLCVDVGKGSQHPVFQSARTEAEMQRNRRVEIFLFQSPLSQSRCVVR